MSDCSNWHGNIWHHSLLHIWLILKLKEYFLYNLKSPGNPRVCLTKKYWFLNVLWQKRHNSSLNCHLRKKEMHVCNAISYLKICINPKTLGFINSAALPLKMQVNSLKDWGRDFSKDDTLSQEPLKNVPFFQEGGASLPRPHRL